MYKLHNTETFKFPCSGNRTHTINAYLAFYPYDKDILCLCICIYALKPNILFIFLNNLLRSMQITFISSILESNNLNTFLFKL